MHFDFTDTRLAAALDKYVQDGPAVTRHLRQEEADACHAFLKSDAAAALRVPTHHVLPQRTPA